MGSVTINWSYVRNASNPETEFVVERKEAGSGHFAKVGSVSPGVFEFVDKTVEDGVNYEWRVTAKTRTGDVEVDGTVTDSHGSMYHSVDPPLEGTHRYGADKGMTTDTPFTDHHPMDSSQSRMNAAVVVDDEVPFVHLSPTGMTKSLPFEDEPVHNVEAVRSPLADILTPAQVRDLSPVEVEDLKKEMAHNIEVAEANLAAELDMAVLDEDGNLLYTDEYFMNTPLVSDPLDPDYDPDDPRLDGPIGMDPLHPDYVARHGSPMVDPLNPTYERRDLRDVAWVTDPMDPAYNPNDPRHVHFSDSHEEVSNDLRYRQHVTDPHDPAYDTRDPRNVGWVTDPMDPAYNPNDPRHVQSVVTDPTVPGYDEVEEAIRATKASRRGRKNVQ